MVAGRYSPLNVFSPGGGGADPFASNPAPAQIEVPEPAGFLPEGVDRSSLMDVKEAEKILRSFDRKQVLSSISYP